MYSRTAQKVTADAFKRAVERVRDPALGSPGAQFFSDVVSITSDGARRLEIRLGHPAGDFLARLALPFACAVPHSRARSQRALMRELYAMVAACAFRS